MAELGQLLGIERHKESALQWLSRAADRFSGELKPLAHSLRLPCPTAQWRTLPLILFGSTATTEISSTRGSDFKEGLSSRETAVLDEQAQYNDSELAAACLLRLFFVVGRACAVGSCELWDLSKRRSVPRFEVLRCLPDVVIITPRTPFQCLFFYCRMVSWYCFAAAFARSSSSSILRPTRRSARARVPPVRIDAPQLRKVGCPPSFGVQRWSRLKCKSVNGLLHRRHQAICLLLHRSLFQDGSEYIRDSGSDLFPRRVLEEESLLVSQH